MSQEVRNVDLKKMGHGGILSLGRVWVVRLQKDGKHLLEESQGWGVSVPDSRVEMKENDGNHEEKKSCR